MSEWLNPNTARGANTACQRHCGIEADNVEILVAQRNRFHDNGALNCIEIGNRPFFRYSIDHIPGLDGDMVFVEQADNDVDGLKDKILESILDPYQNSRTDEHSSFQYQISILGPYGKFPGKPILPSFYDGFHRHFHVQPTDFLKPEIIWRLGKQLENYRKMKTDWWIVKHGYSFIIVSPSCAISNVSIAVSLPVAFRSVD